ncbi:MAG TPA: metallophosphoesterase [Chthoniobacteraceae bacterium]|nr:metallophosphoesterase [Chthoniobacteraceae bacterium]
MRALNLADKPHLVRGPHARIWVHSDLQLEEPAAAEAILKAAVDDLLSLGPPPDAVWCLGDALCGPEIHRQERLSEIIVAQFGRLNAPVCYVMGNHEMDVMRLCGLVRHPLYEIARSEPLWHITSALEETFFVRQFCGIPVVFFSDHAARDGSWWISHAGVHGQAASRPDEVHTLPPLRDAIARHPGPVLTAGHYALPGGQRPLARMSALFPLPANLRLHLYGHAHIGDLKINGANPWQRDNPVEAHSLRQYNISALENVRSPGSHSAMLELDEGGPVSLTIRCHLERRWVERFELGRSPVVSGVA